MSGKSVFRPIEWAKNEDGTFWGKTNDGDLFLTDSWVAEVFMSRSINRDSNGYFTFNATGKPAPQSFHRFVIGARKGEMVDHKNGKKWDNRRANLRLCNKAENGFNRGAPKSNTSGYKGVHFLKRTGRWQAKITKDQKQHHLGYFSTADEAYKAYCEASVEYHGVFRRVM